MNQFPQPTSNDCFVCGRRNPHGLQIRFFDDGQDQVFAYPTVRAAFQGYPGIVHGGITAAILDETVGRVAMIEDHHRFMFSIRLDVKYRLPVPTETPLRVVGKVIWLRGRLGKAEGKIYLPDGNVAAEAALNLIDVPSDIMAEADLSRLGWRIDP